MFNKIQTKSCGKQCLLKCFKLCPKPYNRQKKPINLNVKSYLKKLCSAEKRYLVGNKVKGRISKRVFQENKARKQNKFSEKQTFLTP